MPPGSFMICTRPPEMLFQLKPTDSPYPEASPWTQKSNFLVPIETQDDWGSYQFIWRCPQLGLTPSCHPLKNSCFPKENHPFWGAPILGNHHIKKSKNLLGEKSPHDILFSPPMLLPVLLLRRQWGFSTSGPVKRLRFHR